MESCCCWLLLQSGLDKTFFATSGQSSTVASRSSMNYALPHLLAAHMQSTGHTQRARLRSRLHFTSQPARPPSAPGNGAGLSVLGSASQKFRAGFKWRDLLGILPKEVPGLPCYACVLLAWLHRSFNFTQNSGPLLAAHDTRHAISKPVVNVALCISMAGTHIFCSPVRSLTSLRYLSSSLPVPATFSTFT